MGSKGLHLLLLELLLSLSCSFLLCFDSCLLLFSCLLLSLLSGIFLIFKLLESFKLSLSTSFDSLLPQFFLFSQVLFSLPHFLSLLSLLLPSLLLSLRSLHGKLHLFLHCQFKCFLDGFLCSGCLRCSPTSLILLEKSLTLKSFFLLLSSHFGLSCISNGLEFLLSESVFLFLSTYHFVVLLFSHCLGGLCLFELGFSLLICGLGSKLLSLQLLKVS